jgi:hypothetical protein
MDIDPVEARRPYAILTPGRAGLFAATLAALSVAAGLTSLVENTWRMSGLGLSQHFGMIALYTSAPVLVIVLSALATRFAGLLEHPHEFRTDDTVVAAMIMRGWTTFGGRSDRHVTALLSIAGMLAVVINTMTANSVMTLYSRDTFDSAFHFGSYYIARVYLAFIWCLLYPAAVVLVVRVTYVLTLLIRLAARRSALHLQWFGTDDCAGMARLGNILLLLTVALLLLSAVPIGMYFTGIGGRVLLGATILFYTISTIVNTLTLFVILHRYVRDRKHAQIALLARVGTDAAEAQDWSACSNLLSVRDHFRHVTTVALPFTKATIATLVVILQILLSVASVLPAISR